MPTAGGDRKAGIAMSTTSHKPLRDWTKKELNEALATNAPHVSYSVQQIAAEADRRDRVRAERRLLWIALASTVAAVASAIAAIVTATKP
jgi:hypothetical protein